MATRPNSSPWIADTGANAHITPDITALTLPQQYHGTDSLVVGNGQGLKISHVGSSFISSPSKLFHLSNTLLVPKITKPLLSVSKFCTDNHCFFEFWPSFFVIKDQHTKQELLKGVNEH